jgi:hypothetical protein
MEADDMATYNFFVLGTFLFTLCLGANASEHGSESILHSEFFPTSFGIKSRTLDKNDAETIIKAIQQYKVQHSKSEISKIEILTCTSDYRLPQASITRKNEGEHIQLAKERHEMIKNEISRVLKLPIFGESRLCGPVFNRDDLNDRFVTKDSGPIYEEKFKSFQSDENFRALLKEQALVSDPEKLKELYPSPFLAKYKPFQGVRLHIWGVVKAESSKKVDSKQPSGKNQ